MIFPIPDLRSKLQQSQDDSSAALSRHSSFDDILRIAEQERKSLIQGSMSMPSSPIKREINCDGIKKELNFDGKIIFLRLTTILKNKIN